MQTCRLIRDLEFKLRASVVPVEPAFCDCLRALANSPFLQSVQTSLVNGNPVTGADETTATSPAMREVSQLRALRDFYLRRWRRAVIKHHLPESIAEVMCLKLKSIPHLDHTV